MTRTRRDNIVHYISIKSNLARRFCKQFTDSLPHLLIRPYRNKILKLWFSWELREEIPNYLPWAWLTSQISGLMCDSYGNLFVIPWKILFWTDFRGIYIWNVMESPEKLIFLYSHQNQPEQTYVNKIRLAVCRNIKILLIDLVCNRSWGGVLNKFPIWQLWHAEDISKAY